METKFIRQELDTNNTDMDILRDGVKIGTLSTKWEGKYVHTATLLDGSTGSGTSKAKALAAAESALSQLSPEYRELVETASLDWQVAEYVRLGRIVHEHSANEVKAAAVAEVGRSQHGEVFDTAVANY